MTKKKKIIITILAAVVIIFATIIGVGRHLYIAKMEQPKGDGPKIVCIGDSITYGFGVIMTRNQDAWVRILGNELQDDYEALNYGIGGATLLREGDQPYESDFWEEAIRQNAEIYILMLGTNDSKPQNWDAAAYTNQLIERINELKERTDAETIYVMSPPPAFKKKETDMYAVYDINPVVIENEIRGIVEACAKECDVEYIDLYKALEGHTEYFDDGVHPNKEGNAAIAEAILKAFQQ